MKFSKIIDLLLEFLPFLKAFVTTVEKKDETTATEADKTEKN